ncbi:MAG TPA: chemotaxis protein CheB [Pseudonocardiaceae bacterium]|jgi:two-component system chemotaxis response regulator CheB|nr:chemotaxis protein CheB [Pseudonocardiaceae bacterium]
MRVRPAQSLIVVGASAGGVEALRELTAGLPIDLPAAVLVVLHLPPGRGSALDAILDRVGPLPAVTARHGERLQAGTVYTAVPDQHLLVEADRIALSHGATENGYRPSVDALFRSAAMAWGSRVIGVVLSGTLGDGTVGLLAIKSRGGLAVVQDPRDALHRGMPDSALAQVTVDRVLSAQKLGGALADMAQPPDRPSGAITEQSPRQRPAEEQKALWAALRALEEKRRLADQMSDNARRNGLYELAQRYADQGVEQAEAAEVLREMLLGPASG